MSDVRDGWSKLCCAGGTIVKALCALQGIALQWCGVTSLLRKGGGGALVMRVNVSPSEFAIFSRIRCLDRLRFRPFALLDREVFARLYETLV